MNIKTETLAIISTAHITEEDAARLADAYHTMESISLGSSEAGWYVNMNFLLNNQDEFSNVFRQLVGTVLEYSDADWILFDQDGEVYDNLPTFEW